MEERERPRIVIPFEERRTRERRKKMPQSARNIDRLSEAMQTLDELAAQEREAIKELLSGQFGNLRRTILEVEPELRSSIRTASEKFSRFASNTKEATKERMKEIGKNVDEKVHQSPWPFIGVSAIGGLIAGYYLANRVQARPSSERA